jgi:hypothetical protein
MFMQFNTFLTVGVSHAYYRQSCQDFDFILPADSSRLLKNGGLVAKVMEGKLYVFLAADRAVSSARVVGKTLRIGLKLLNPFFSNFTQADFEFNKLRAFYRNRTASNALDPVKTVSLVGDLYSHPVKSSQRPVILTIRNLDGQGIRRNTLVAKSDDAAIAYNLSDQPSGVYTVEETVGTTKKNINYYSDPDLHQRQIFGIVEIKIDPSFYQQPPEFNIPFLPKQEYLKYYVVANHYPDLNNLMVVDGGEPGRAAISFNKILPTAFTKDDILPNLLGNSHAKVALFKSQTTVARQEQMRQKIQLRNNGEVLISSLPQPAANRPNSDLIIQISKPKTLST